MCGLSPLAPVSGAFHHNKLNQLIHIIFVPLIVWSGMVFFVLATPGATHAFMEFDDKSTLALILPQHGLNLSLIGVSFYIIYYLTLDFWPAVVYDCFLFALYHGANWVS